MSKVLRGNLKPPIVSVIMPVHNGERHVKEAVESILLQTFRDFELIVMNDGSTDGTSHILDSLSLDDDRVSVHHYEKIGFCEALNRACALARGKYIARMDADDVSLPRRFDEQVKFLEDHPEITVCGSWVKAFGPLRSQVVRYPTKPEDLKCRLLFNSHLAHPSVMMRKELFADGLRYQSQFQEAADYSLWVDVSKFGALVNIPKVLLMYRVHESQVSKYDWQHQHQFAHEIRLKQLNSLGVTAEPRESELHRLLSTYNYSGDKRFVRDSEAWLLKLAAANEKSKQYDSSTFSQVLADYWLTVCMGATALGMWTFRTFLASPLANKGRGNLTARAKLLLKCLARGGVSTNGRGEILNGGH